MQKHLPLHTTIIRADLLFQLKKNSLNDQTEHETVIFGIPEVFLSMGWEKKRRQPRRREGMNPFLRGGLSVVGQAGFQPIMMFHTRCGSDTSQLLLNKVLHSQYKYRTALTLF